MQIVFPSSSVADCRMIPIPGCTGDVFIYMNSCNSNYPIVLIVQLWVNVNIFKLSISIKSNWASCRVSIVEKLNKLKYLLNSFQTKIYFLPFVSFQVCIIKLDSIFPSIDGILHSCSFSNHLYEEFRLKVQFAVSLLVLSQNLCWFLCCLYRNIVCELWRIDGWNELWAFIKYAYRSFHRF